MELLALKMIFTSMGILVCTGGGFLNGYLIVGILDRGRQKDTIIALIWFIISIPLIAYAGSWFFNYSMNLGK